MQDGHMTIKHRRLRLPPPLHPLLLPPRLLPPKPAVLLQVCAPRLSAVK